MLKLVTPSVVSFPTLGGGTPATSNTEVERSVTASSPTATIVHESISKSSPATSGPKPATVASPAPPSDPILPQPTTRSGEFTSTAPQMASPATILLTIWLIGVIIWTIVNLKNHRRFRQILRSTIAAPHDLTLRCTQIATRLGLSPKIPDVEMTQLRLSPMLWVPLTGRPKLLLPDEFWSTLDPTQQDAILAHELAHWKRGDHWVRRLEMIVLALHWWNPVAWWARRELERAEEQCCDAIVLQALPSAAEPYAEALVSTAIFLSGLNRRLPLGISAAGRTQPLKRRLNMILSDRPNLAMTRRSALAFLASGLICLPFLPGLASGQSAPAPAGVQPTVPVNVQASAQPAPKPAAATQAKPAEPPAPKTSNSTKPVDANRRKFRVAQPIAREVSDYEIRPGTVEASGRIDIQPQVNGRLSKINVKLGQSVKEGDVLFEIDPRRYQIEFEKAQAEVRQARARVQAKRTAQHQADRLRQNDKAEIYRIEAEEAEAAVQSAQASADLAGLALAATRVKAPFSGRMMRLMSEIGGQVSESTLLGTLVVVNPVSISFRTPQKTIVGFNRLRREGSFKDGDPLRMPVKICIQGEVNFAHDGTAELVEIQKSPDAYNTYWRVPMSNIDNVFIPNMRVDVKMDTTAPYKAFLISDSAFLNGRDGSVVFTMNQDETIISKRVKLGSRFDGFLAVKSGLKPDDWVVLDLNLGASGGDGMKIIPDRVPMRTDVESSDTTGGPRNF
jgi:multidrug efflux system membrane fusion protein